jgi:hypothetical protein
MADFVLSLGVITLLPAARIAWHDVGWGLVVMTWVYYSSQVLLCRAEFASVYANRFGSRIIAVSPTARPPEESSTYPQY